MRFSIIGAPRQRYDLGESAANAWWDWVEDALLAEKLGFDAVYTGEHHFCFASGNSAPLILLTESATSPKLRYSRLLRSTSSMRAKY